MRHAEAEGNKTRVFQGWTDGSITDVGHVQAGFMAEKIKSFKIDVLFSSSLKRAIQTAEYISKVKSLPVLTREGLKEIYGGEWEGVPWEELPKRWPCEYYTWENEPLEHKMPMGESMSDFQKRIVDEIKNIANENIGKNICLVFHGTAIRVFMSYVNSNGLLGYNNITWYDNTSITTLEYENDIFTTLSEGDCSHLSMNLKTLGNQEWWIEKQKNTQIKE